MSKDNQKILQNILSKSEEEFVHYDPALDCINPEASRPLMNAGDDTLTRFYAFRNNKIDYDADTSIEANLIYQKVFESIYDGKASLIIRKQAGKYNSYGLKYELGEAEGTGEISFRGDTMNSVVTTNRAYCQCHKELQLHEEKNDDDFSLPKEALKLIDLYHTPGNFMLLPCCSGVSINCDRGRGNAKDYFDLFLMAVYNFYLVQNDKEWANNITLARVLENGKTVTFMRSYLMSFMDLGTSNWESFVEKNLLQDFVEIDHDGNYGQPKELWKGHFEEFEKTKYALPTKEEQCFEFWNHAADRIQRRSRKIYKKLKTS